MSAEYELHLVRAIVDLAAFLELSGEDVLNEDVAVAQLEQLAARLQGMDSEGKSSFLSLLARVAQEEKSPERVEFIESLGESLGLIE